MSPKKLAVAAVLGMTVASPAMAQSMADRGWYLGGSLGQSDIDDSITTGLTTSNSSFDGKDTAFKAFGGYMFNRNFGAELAYVNLGEASYSGTFFGLPVTGGKVEITGFNISAIGVYPVNQAFSVFGKVGFMMWDAEASDTTAGTPFSEKTDGTDLSFGAGLSYSFTRNLAVRAEWERFKTENADADLLSVGLVYKF